jgi:hypothetical protein
MLLSRGRFFLLLFFVLVGPFCGPKLFWFICSRQTVGKVYFTGGQLDAISGTRKYLYIRFPLGKDTRSPAGNDGRSPAGDDTVEFISNMFFRWPDDTPVMVRYSRLDPVDARIDLPVCIWGDTLVHILLPMGIWLVLLLTPNRFDPLIPWGCKLLLRWGWPPVKIVEAGRPEIGRAPKSEGRCRSDGGRAFNSAKRRPRSGGDLEK